MSSAEAQTRLQYFPISMVSPPLWRNQKKQRFVIDKLQRAGILTIQDFVSSEKDALINKIQCSMQDLYELESEITKISDKFVEITVNQLGSINTRILFFVTFLGLETE